MTDISKILTAVLSGGTQPGGGGGLFGQLGQTPAGGSAPGGLDALLRGLSGGGQQAPSGGGAGGSTLFDQLATALRNAQGGTEPPRAQAASGGPAGAPGGTLLDQLMSVIQGAQQKAGTAMAGAAGTPLGDMLNQAGDLLKKHGGGFGGGAAAGTLAGLLLGTGAGRQIAGAAARLGGLAAIGGLAYVALRNFQQGKPVVQGTINDVSSILGLGSPPQGFADAAGTVDETAEILLRSMVAGAYADGHMSPEERQSIVGQLDSMGLGTAEKSYLDGMLAAPVSMKLIAAACVTDEMKAQAYIAAQMGITADTAAERQFLKDFAAALGLAPGLVAHLDQAAADAKAARDA
ncbi:tellurite resistance TerB family protein [Phreatobacter sp.]|uniref:tellurite resistance TerB family protein n=1 Tax=Phreatobacter sp. TaxID=1966341 RepID=UPI003F6F330E